MYFCVVAFLQLQVDMYDIILNLISEAQQPIVSLCAQRAAEKCLLSIYHQRVDVTCQSKIFQYISKAGT